jgi:hypothetical protein
MFLCVDIHGMEKTREIYFNDVTMLKEGVFFFANWRDKGIKQKEAYMILFLERNG